MTRQCKQIEFLDLAELGEATIPFDVKEMSILSVQIGGTISAGAVKVETRLEDGAWVDLLDSAGSSITISGTGMRRAIDIIGADEVRVVVSTIEATKGAEVIFCAWE